MVKSGTLSSASELSDFASETRDVVLSYFSLLPVNAQDGILNDSLNSNSTNSSTTRTFKGDLFAAGRRSKEALHQEILERSSSRTPEKFRRGNSDTQVRVQSLPKHVRKESSGEEDLADSARWQSNQQQISNIETVESEEEEDFVDSGRHRTHRQLKQQPKHRYARSMSYDEHNLRKRSKEAEKSESKMVDNKDNKDEKKPSPNNLLIESKQAYHRARSVSPARPTTLNIIPVYPSTSLTEQLSQWDHVKPSKYDRKVNKIDSFEKKDLSKEDTSRKLNFDAVHSGLKRQISNRGHSLPKPISKPGRHNERHSLQSSQDNSIDRSSLNSDASPKSNSFNSKTQSSGNSESVVSVLDWEDDEVKRLVDESIVSPLALSLKHAIEENITEKNPPTAESVTRTPRSRPSDFGKRLSGSLNSKITRSPGARCVTPQTEVAQLIAAIGDQIQHDYGHILNQAISTAAAIPEESIDAATLGEIITSVGLINREHGWKKGVMVLEFCKGLALALVSKNRSISRLLDSTVEMLADSFADFVIRQGGWMGILSADTTPTSLLTPVSSPIDENETFPPDWQDGIEPLPGTSTGEVDGPFQPIENSDNAIGGAVGGAVGGLQIGDNQNQTPDKSSPIPDGRRKESNSLENKELERVRMEIWLMRQISEQYDQENQHKRKWSFFSTAAMTVISISLLGGVLVLCYKRRERLGALFSSLRK